MSLSKVVYHSHMIRCSTRHSQPDLQTRINCTTVNNGLRRYMLNLGLLHRMGSSEIRLLFGPCNSTEIYSHLSITQDDSSKLPDKSMDRPTSYRGLASIPNRLSCRVLVTPSTATGENPLQYRERSWKNDSDVLQTRQVDNLPGRHVQRRIGMAMMWRLQKHDRLRWVCQAPHIRMATMTNHLHQSSITRKINSWVIQHTSKRKIAPSEDPVDRLHKLPCRTLH